MRYWSANTLQRLVLNTFHIIVLCCRGFRNRMARECVTTHLPNEPVLKINDAEACIKDIDLICQFLSARPWENQPRSWLRFDICWKRHDIIALLYPWLVVVGCIGDAMSRITLLQGFYQAPSFFIDVRFTYPVLVLIAFTSVCFRFQSVQKIEHLADVLHSLSSVCKHLYRLRTSARQWSSCSARSRNASHETRKASQKQATRGCKHWLCSIARPMGILSRILVFMAIGDLKTSCQSGYSSLKFFLLR